MKLLPDLFETETTEIEVAEDATPLDFLCAVYRDPTQPKRMRLAAATAAAQYVHPKLAAIATVHSFGDQMNEIARQGGRSNVIDARPVPQITDPAGIRTR